MASASPLAPSQTSVRRLIDSHGRVIHDLRVSITDRCNYKCVYCRTGELGAQYPELGIEEYLRLIKLFVNLGIEKVRITGGEPLLRHGLIKLIEELAKLRTIGGEPLDLALTTNGHLLDNLAAPLKAAGLNRVTVSMDAVDEPTFERITRVPGSFKHVLAGIRAARAAGLTPVKINCVLLRGFNDNEIERICPLCPRRRCHRALHRIHAAGGRPPLDARDRRASARNRRPHRPRHAAGALAAARTQRDRPSLYLSDGVGEIGIIAPVSQAFCGACSRVRLTSDGKIRTCLFSQIEHDLYGSMRAGGDETALSDYIVKTINGKKRATISASLDF